MRLIRAEELAQMTGLSVRCVRKYLRQGVVPARKLGNEWFMTEDAVREYFGNKRPMVSGKSTRVREGDWNVSEHG